MAIFSGNIIEAYYANSDNDTIEVIYKQGEQAINHFLKVDYNDSILTINWNQNKDDDFKSYELKVSNKGYEYTFLSRPRLPSNMNLV